MFMGMEFDMATRRKFVSVILGIQSSTRFATLDGGFKTILAECITSVLDDAITLHFQG
jgi:hypothetical protein